MQLKLNKFRNIFILILIGITSNHCLYSQDNAFTSEQDTMELKPKYGVIFGYNLNFHNADFRSLPGVPSCCPQYTGGFGTGFYFGALLDYPLNPKMELSGRITFNQLNGELKRYEQTTVLLDGAEAIGEFEHYVNSKFSLLGIEPLFTYKIQPAIAVHAGLRIGFMTSADYYQIEKISKPIDRGTFLDGRTYRNQSQGSLMDSVNSLQFGFKIGASYTLSADKKKTLFIVPEIFYTLNPTNFIKERDWSVNNLSFGVGIKYRIPPPPPPPPMAPVPPPDPEIPLIFKQPVLALDIDAIEVDSNQVQHKNFSFNVEDFISINMRPLLNYIFFDENSYEIPSKYVQFDKENAEKFDESYLGNLNALETYYYLLNIVGKRMNKDPETTITLTGTNSNVNFEKNNKELSKSRAQAVADYLIKTWNIDPNRITVNFRNLPDQHSKEDDPLGMQENRRVEITSDNIRITEPVLTKDTMRILKIQEIKFIPKVLTEAGLQYWEMNVKQKEQTLFSQKGSGKVPESWSWKISKQNIPTEEGDLSYSLYAIDSVGQSGTSKTKRIPVSYNSVDKKRKSGEQDKEFEYYSLILFDYGKSDLGFEHRKVVDFVKGRINPESKLVVYGYTDSMGDEKINDKISRERANAVLKRLEIKDNIQIEGKGESELLYDNSLPEGRFYCRTVTIDIETPVTNIQK